MDPALAERARSMARLASGLAAGAGVALPDDLGLWSLAGGRPDAAATHAGDPAATLGSALEAALTHGERRRGAHFTPAAVADRVVELALAAIDVRRPPRVVDPACGGGALLLAAARRLASAGVPPVTVSRELLWGADLDPLAAAVTEAAIALWAGGASPGPDHVVAGDPLRAGAAAWPAPPDGGFDAVVGNPPFQGQLASATARDRGSAAQLRRRFGTSVGPYVDTAALFLLVGVELAADGGRVAMVQPQSTAAARGAAGVRSALAARARLVDLWAPADQLFAAQVQVCVPVLEVGAGEAVVPSWTGRVAAARGVPSVHLVGARSVGDLADVLAGFRDEYYGLVGHVHEASSHPEAPLVTSGLIDVGSVAWGTRPARFAKRRWDRPAVDVAAAAAANPRVGTWLARTRRPKVVVATQTRVLESAADLDGGAVPCTPVVSALPHRAGDVAALAAVLNAPPAAAWAAWRAAGSALSAGALRVSTALVAAVPLPVDRDAWREAARRLAAGDLAGYSEVATAMYGLAPAEARDVRQWWSGQVGLDVACHGPARPR